MNTQPLNGVFDMHIHAFPDVAPRKDDDIGLATAAAALAASALMYAAWGTTLLQSQQFAILTTSSIPALLALWATPRATPSTAQTRQSGPLSRLAQAGRYSLGIYLIHAPLLNVLRYVTGTRDSDSLALGLLLALASIGISLAASYVIGRSRRLAPLVM